MKSLRTRRLKFIHFVRNISLNFFLLYNYEVVKIEKLFIEVLWIKKYDLLYVRTIRLEKKKRFFLAIEILILFNEFIEKKN